MKKHLVSGLIAAAAVCVQPVLANGVCNPTSTETCGIPFPSNFWATPVLETTTGIELNVSNDILRPEVLEQLPIQDGFTPEGIFNGYSGFSAASAVVFEFASEPVASSLPKEGGDTVIAIDLTTGETLPVFANISDYAKSDLVSAPSDVVEIFPQSRWPYGHKILVAVTSELELALEQPLLDEIIADSDADQFSYVTELQAALAEHQLDPASLRNATLFTVRTRNEVVGPMLRAVADVRSNAHPVRDINVRYLDLKRDVAALVTGEVLVHNYRTNYGTGIVDFDAQPQEQWIEFRLTLPEQAREGSVPVSLYAHGLGLNKETDTLVSDINSELGIATFSVGFPNHGARAEADGGNVLQVLSTDQLAKPIGMMVQFVMDFGSAHQALKTSLANIDVLGQRSLESWCKNCPDGVPDIDPSRIMMQGTSLGGVLGSTYGSIAPDVKGAVYHVTGVGVTSILSGSILWESMFEKLEPEAANGSEALLLRGAIQQSLDYGDSINYIDYFRYPIPGTQAKPIMLTMGNGDSMVTNESSVAAAQLLDLPIVGDVLVDMPGVRQSDDFDADGYGLKQYEPVYDPRFLEGDLATELSHASAHLIFVRKKDKEDQKAFIQRFLMDE